MSLSVSTKTCSVKFKITPVLPFQRIMLLLKITGWVHHKRKSGWHWYCDTIIITSYTFWLRRQIQTIVKRPLPFIEATDKISSQHKRFTVIEFIDEGCLKIGEVNAKTSCDHLYKTSPVINVEHKIVDSVKKEEGKQVQAIGWVVFDEQISAHIGYNYSLIGVSVRVLTCLPATLILEPLTTGSTRSVVIYAEIRQVFSF